MRTPLLLTAVVSLAVVAAVDAEALADDPSSESDPPSQNEKERAAEPNGAANDAAVLPAEGGSAHSSSTDQPSGNQPAPPAAPNDPVGGDPASRDEGPSLEATPASAPGVVSTNGPAADPSAETGRAATQESTRQPALERSASATGNPLSSATESASDASAEAGLRPPITLEAAIELALERHPRVIEAQQRTRTREAFREEAGAAYYPQVNVWLQALRGTMNGNQAVFFSVPGNPRVGGGTPDGVGSSDSFNNFHAAAVVHQLLYDFGRTRGVVDAQKAFLEAARLNEGLIEQNVIFEVTSSFINVLEAVEALAVAEESVALTERVLEFAKAGQDAGLRPPSEGARAEADVAMAELDRIRAELNLDFARARFANALGTPEELFEPSGPLPETGVVGAEKACIEIALSRRPELRALGLQQDALVARGKSVRAELYPRLGAVAGLNARGQFLRGGDFDDFADHNWNVGVMLHIPVFQGGRIRQRFKALQAESRALQQSEEVVRQSIVLEVKQAWAQVRAADEAVRASAKGVQAAKVNFDTIKGRYNTGLSSIVEITDARAAYISALSAALRASYGARFTRAALNLALGSRGLN